MSQGPLCPNLTKKVQKEVSQMANRKLSCAMLYRWFKCKLQPPKNEHIKKIYDVNEQDYRIAVKNYDLNKEIEKYLNQVGILIVHPDVVYALESLQKIGATM